jgi:serine/threonine protein kinase
LGQAGPEHHYLGLTDEADATLFDWSLKLSWACQITRGVVELHSISAYNGDLKPNNVLIDSGGQAILIDFLPMGFSDPFVAPEVLAKSHDGVTESASVLTAPADVYSLGVFLYVVGEEKLSGIHPIVWRDGGTCAWYREIVERCLNLDPDSRPSASEVLSVLENGR